MSCSGHSRRKKNGCIGHYDRTPPKRAGQHEPAGRFETPGSRRVQAVRSFFGARWLKRALRRDKEEMEALRDG